MSALRAFHALVTRDPEPGAHLHLSPDGGGRDESTGSGPWAELRREIARARRFTRPFAIIRIKRRRNDDGWVAYGRALGSLVRSVDAMWEADDAVFLLLPESDRAAGERLVARLRHDAPELVPAEDVALAAFPEDGLTSGALLSHLEGEGRIAAVPEREPVVGGVPFDAPVAHAHGG